MLKKMATMAAALSLVVGSVAPAFAAQPLSLADTASMRASAGMGASNALDDDEDSMWMQLAALGGVALLVLAIVLILDDDIDLDQPLPPNPVSP